MLEGDIQPYKFQLPLYTKLWIVLQWNLSIPTT